MMHGPIHVKQEKIFRKKTNGLHPLKAGTTLLFNCLSRILLVLTFYIDMYIVKPRTVVSILSYKNELVISILLLCILMS